MSGTVHNMALSFAQELVDRESFDALVQRRSRFVFQVAHAALGRVHDAEDVVQEVFLRLYRTGAWRRMQDEAAFLARTTWRLARSRQMRFGTPSGTGSEEEFLAARALAPSPEQCAMDLQQEVLVRRLVSQLPAEFRYPLILSAIDEMPSAAVGEALGIPAATVRSRVLRARQLLREKYNALTGEKR
jgi:RNA polymerase sigma-70 factor, ECF subfamily